MTDAQPEPGTLDYADLVANYSTNLLEQLRGFGTQHESLALWVPDEDVLIGLANLFDALASAGETSCSVRIGPDLLRSHPLASWSKIAGEFGVVDAQTDDMGLRLQVDQLRIRIRERAQTPVSKGAATPRKPVASTERQGLQGIEPAAVHNRYSTRLRTVGLGHGSCRSVPESAAKNEVIVRAESGGHTLWWQVDAETHIIRAAGHDDELGEGEALALEERGALEYLCRLLPGLPVQEAADHGVSRVELALRGDVQAVQAGGVLLAKRAHPAFDFAQSITRALRTRYAERTGWHEHANDFDAGVSERWAGLEPAARTTELLSCFRRFEAENSLDAGGLELAALEHDVRVVVTMPEAIAAMDRASLAMKLEHALQSEVDPRLEVFLQEVRDDNKIRRLSVLREPSGECAR